MSDAANGTKGLQAYRWLVTIGMALITTLSWRVLGALPQMEPTDPGFPPPWSPPEDE
jgi:hypothetical protein